MIVPNCFMFGHNIENSFDYSEESISRENTILQTSQSTTNISNN